jgi:hypothetical protein
MLKSPSFLYIECNKRRKFRAKKILNSSDFDLWSHLVENILCPNRVAQVRNILMLKSPSNLYNEGNQKRKYWIQAILIYGRAWLKIYCVRTAWLKSGIFWCWNRLRTCTTSVTSEENIEWKRFWLMVEPVWKYSVRTASSSPVYFNGWFVLVLE